MNVDKYIKRVIKKYKPVFNYACEKQKSLHHIKVTELYRTFVGDQLSAAWASFLTPSIRLAPLIEAVKDAGVEAGRNARRPNR